MATPTTKLGVSSVVDRVASPSGKPAPKPTLQGSLKPKSKVKSKPKATAKSKAAGAVSGPESLPAPSPSRAAPPEKRGGAEPQALVQRIYDMIDGELTKLEKQKGTSSQDRERAARALAQMVNSLEKAVDMQRDIAKADKGAGSKDKEALAYAEQLREEIAQRLERLIRKRAARK